MRSLRWAFLVTFVSASAQTPAEEPPYLKEMRSKIETIKQIKGDPSFIEGTRRDRIAREISFANSRTRYFLQYCYARSLPRFVNLAPTEEARTDMQVGSSASASGSTSLVAKASTPSIFGMALENGGFAQSVNGTTFTLRGNLVGFTDLLANRDYLSAFNDDSKAARFLRRVSFSVSLDMSRRPLTSTPVSGSAGSGSINDAIRNQLELARQELSNYSIRIDLLNRRDPRDPRNFQGMTALFDESMNNLLADVDTAVGDLQTSDEYLRWISATTDELLMRSGTDLDVVFFRRLDQLCDIAHKLVPDFDQKLQKALSSYERLFGERASVLKSLEKQPLLAVEYVVEREPQQPDLNTTRLIYERQFRQTRLDLTANASASWWYRNTSTGVQGLRDWQISGQADLPLGPRCTCGGSGVGNPVLSFAILVEKLKVKAPVTFGGGTIETDPGVLAVGQLKLTIPFKNTGVKVPLSFSVANRTELIQEKDVRANIGVTFDFDTVAALFHR